VTDPEQQPGRHPGQEPGPQPGLEPGLQRDSVTHAGYAVLATWAWFLYGFGAILPLLRAEQGTSRAVLGMHSLALACGGLIAGGLAVPLVRRVHRRGAFTVGGLLAATGVVALTVAPVPALTIAATVLTGTGGSVLLQAAAPSLMDHHRRFGPAVLSEGNAVAAAVGLVAPLAVWAATSLGWTWRPAALVEVPLIGVLLLLVRRVPAGTAAIDTGLPPRGDQPRKRLVGVFWVFLALLMACVAIEFCCAAWSADLLRTRTGMSAGAASIGVTAVVSGMAVGRFAIGRLALRYTPRQLLLGALALTAVGWAITWLSTAPGPAVAGLVVIGLGIAGHYPLAASITLGSVPGQSDQASGAISIGISSAAGLAPFALGAVADASSTHTAFLAVPIFVMVATTALLISRRSVGPRTAVA
jgi:predicted MFS family arabinose efflux permease